MQCNVNPAIPGRDDRPNEADMIFAYIPLEPIETDNQEEMLAAPVIGWMQAELREFKAAVEIGDGVDSNSPFLRLSFSKNGQTIMFHMDMQAWFARMCVMHENILDTVQAGGGDET